MVQSALHPAYNEGFDAQVFARSGSLIVTETF